MQARRARTSSDPVEALFQAPLASFVAARARAAAALRARGERARAAEVAGLKKPSMLVWTLNQLARTDRAGLAKLIAAGESMRHAFDGGGNGVAALRDARHVRDASVARLLARASRIVRASHHVPSRDLLRGVRGILLQASVDPKVRDAVVRGQLVEAPRSDALPTFASAGARKRGHLRLVR